MAVAAGLAAAVPLSGPVTAAGTWSVAAMSSAVDRAAEDREFVRWIAMADWRAPVQTAARLALRAGDTGIAEFLATGFDNAIARANELRARNVSFTERMLATHQKRFYPNVHAAGDRALAGTDDQLAAFVATGFAAAKEADRRGQQADADAAAKIVQDDRDFVTRLRDNDPGAQVRAAAGRALTSGDAADVAEFLLHRWVSAATLDLQMYRARCADQDAAWRTTINGLIEDAQAAEAAARGTAGEAGVQARAAAARAWATVGQQTGPARVAWAQAQQVAEHQAATWQQVAQAAGAAESTNWNAIAGTALGTREQWLAEKAHAALQAVYWQKLYNDAVAAELVLTAPPAS